MSSTELDRLKAEIESANGSPELIRRVFSDLADRFGREEASVMWMAVFAAEDASET